MPNSESARWLSVFALACAAFIFNTTEFIPVALLSDIGAGFAMKPADTGIMITVYAWVVALMSLPLMLTTRNTERRGLLLVLFAVFSAAHVLSYFAQSFAVLLASRVAVALTHALFWSITAALAVRVAPQGKGNQALGILSTGTVLAMVLGIPLGRLAGNAYGWRLSFLLIGLAAVPVALVLAKSLPKLPSANTGSLDSLPVLAKRKSLMLLYAFTILMITAHFTAYSYIEPFALQSARFAPQQATLLLLVYGAAGFAGSYLFGRHFSRNARVFFAAATAATAAAMFLLLPLSAPGWLLMALCFFWGIVITTLGLAMISRVLHFAADATDVASSIYSSLFNVGIGGGALFGRYAAQWFGLNNIGYAGGSLAALALLLALVLVKQPDFADAPQGKTDAEAV
ncbi:sugar transporter [Neisseria sp. WLZKY-1]|uniref:sugar transporter n=1 Tax=Neisseria sp. WLZKY-1 TaxID=3390377 RepID=UPI00397E6F48